MTARRWSLAARMTVWYGCAAFVLVALVVSSLYWALIAHFSDADRAVLGDQVQILRSHLTDADDVAAMLRSEVVDEAAARRYAHLFVRVLDAQGHEMIETPGMDAVMSASAFPAPPPDATAMTVGETVQGLDRDPYVLVSAAAVIRDRGTGLIQAALNIRSETDLIAAYKRRMALALVLALAASALGGYALARRGLAPLADFGRSVGGIGSTTLGDRLPITHLPGDLADLGASFNLMLARLEDAFARLSRFSADIAHELRTPVNNLRGEAEVALGKTRSPDEYREVLASGLEECGRLTRLIDSLLFLARAESPRMHIARERVDLHQELDVLSAFYGTAAEEAGVVLRCACEAAPLAISADRTLMQRALGNLIENALAYTPAGGSVSVSAARVEGELRLSVSDTGCGIPADHLPYVFDRFHRVEQARSNPAGHVGLGLALVRSIASVHGGSADIASQVGRGTTVTIRLPVTDP